jgi:hypothetical protein
MNFKKHVDFAIRMLARLGPGENLRYAAGIGVTPSDGFLKALASELPGIMASDEEVVINCGAVVLSCHAQWARWGLNVFEPTDSLAAGLSITTPSTELGFPRLPYPAFFVRVPVGFIPFWVDGGDKPPQWIVGILVGQLVVAGVEPVTHTLEMELLGSGSGLYGDKEKSVSCTITEHNFSSSADYVKADDDTWITKERSDLSPQSFGFGEAGMKSTIYFRHNELDFLTRRLAFRFVANLCSWVESVGGMTDKKPTNSIQKCRRHDGTWSDLASKQKITQWVVGREVKLDSHLLASAKEHVLALANNTDTKKTWSLTAMHTVRGHITHQVYGPGRTQRKVIWVKPYVRGPAAGDVVAHIYKIQNHGE